MHILMICALEVWALPSGGGAPTLYRTLRAYSERGHRVTFITSTIGANAYLPQGRLKEATAATAPALPRLTFSQFHLPSVQESRLPLPPLASKLDQKLRFALLFPRLAAKHAMRVLQREPIDVLYAYEVHGALAVQRLQSQHQLPTVARFQGTVMYPSLDSTLARLRRFEEILALRTPADLYIMTNDGTRGDDVLARINPSSMTKLRFWRNGLDLDRLTPADGQRKATLRTKLGLPIKALVLLTASRLAAWKRIDRAVAALPRVLADEANARLVIVGDGEERSHLEHQVAELGIGDRVLFAGSVPQDRVPEYMQAADVLLALADLSNVGNPLLEAMCCALPIVAVDAGDTAELIRNGETGVLLPTGSADEVARAVVELSRDRELRARLAAGAHTYAERHFWTWEDRLAAEIDEVERLAGLQSEAPADHVTR